MKEKGTVESEAGAQEGRSDEGPPRGDRIGVRKRRWADDPWNAPGGPASPIPGLGVSKQLGQRLSSASSVYGLAAARPVAGGGGVIRNVPCAVEGPGKAGGALRPAPSARPRPARVGKPLRAPPSPPSPHGLGTSGVVPGLLGRSTGRALADSAVRVILFGPAHT